MDEKPEIKHFVDLDAWQVNREVVLVIYKITKKFPKDEKFGLTSQLRRASVSIITNIAEGWGRFHYKDKVRFYHQARGSNTEVQSLLIVAKDLGYISEEEFDEMKVLIFRGFKVLNGLIRSTEKRS
jgi:four helix bundle protein